MRQLALTDMGAAAQVHRIALEYAMPSLIGFHTPGAYGWFYRERVFPTCRVWGRFDGDELSGIIALSDGCIEQLYVLPSAHGRGIGTELLDVAKGAYERLELWTFQRNAPARRFYEARGFTLAEETNGTRNEEREPDARYVWTRTSP
jgi:GNAT superfamily N-acetyltransferase